MFNKQNQELQERNKTNSGFISKMLLADKKFREIQQLAYYIELPQSAKEMVIAIKSNDGNAWMPEAIDNQNLFILLGSKQPTGNDQLQKLLMSIATIIPRPESDYSMVYINSTATKNAYSDFQKITDYLPIPYLKYLNRIFVLNGSSKFKYQFTFDYLTGYIKKKTIHFSTMKEIVESVGLRIQNLLKILPSQLVFEFGQKEEYVKKITDLKVDKSNNRSGSRKLSIQNSSPELEMKKMSSSGLKISNKKKAKSIEDYDIGQTGAPLIIELMLHFFDFQQQFLKTEGLFRKSANIQQQTVLLQQLQKQNYEYLDQITDAHLIANGIKRFLSNINEPIFPFQAYQELMITQPAKIQVVLKDIIMKLSINRKMTLILLIDFFHDKILPKRQFNKMSEKNLSIVFGPCLMYSQIPSIKDIVNTQKSINIIQVMIQDHQNIFGNRKQRKHTIRNSIRLQERQSLLEKLKNQQKEGGESHENVQIIENLQRINEQLKKDAQQEDENFEPLVLSGSEQFELAEAQNFMQAFSKNQQKEEK